MTASISQVKHNRPIEAMNEFSPAMAEAGRLAYNWRGDGYDERVDRICGGDRVFLAMIDAALTDSPTTEDKA